MSANEVSIPWPQVTKFISQLNHDVRNHLNAIELQSAFLGEIVEGDEAKAEVRRLREMTAEMGAQLQRLSSKLGKTNLQTMSYSARELGEDLQAKIAADFPVQGGQVEWQLSLGTETLEVDPQLLLEAFAELITNAFAHSRGTGPLLFSAQSEDSAVTFSLREPKSGPLENVAEWGQRPLAHLRHGHYALGLFRARGIFEAHHGTYQAHFDPAASVLTTSVTLPASR
jgi:light-regulated signal transduction histidine kinase (bacteriophytochrome)